MGQENIGAKMKLFLISQRENKDWDTFDSFVAAALDEETARNMSPDGGVVDWKDKSIYSNWCSKPSEVFVKYLGEASPEIKQGVICASFRAG